MKRLAVCSSPVWALLLALFLCTCPAFVFARHRVGFIERGVHASAVLSQFEAELALPATFNTSNPTGASKLPLHVFFFHGNTNGPSEGTNIVANLMAEERLFVALSFSPNACSTRSLHTQARLAITQTRSIVQGDSRHDDGYIFVAQSQGGILARAVIKGMDDHRIRKLISLGGVQKGIFYGPRAADQASLKVLMAGFGVKVVPREVFDFDSYANDPSSLRGEMQRNLAQLIVDQPKLQHESSFVNLARFPAFDDWVKANAFLPVLNNVNRCGTSNETKCEEDKQRRKRNFLKLQAAYFFASPNDGVVAPWQVSLFGRYSEVSSVDEIATKFEQLTIVDMHDTLEYVNDTFGLRSLDERGALFLHQVPVLRMAAGSETTGAETTQPSSASGSPTTTVTSTLCCDRDRQPVTPCRDVLLRRLSSSYWLLLRAVSILMHG